MMSEEQDILIRPFLLYFLLPWCVVFAILFADKEVELVDDVRVLAIQVHVIILAVISLLACLLAEVRI